FRGSCSHRVQPGSGPLPWEACSGQAAQVSAWPSLVARSQSCRDEITSPACSLAHRLLPEAFLRRVLRTCHQPKQQGRVTPDGDLACARRSSPSERQIPLARSAAREVAGGRTRPSLLARRSVVGPSRCRVSTASARKRRRRLFVGHYGVGFAGKKNAPSTPLWMLFLAVQLLDVIWAPLVLLGIEKLSIVPGITKSNALFLYYMPYTHSLVAAVLWSAVAFVVYRFFAGREKEREALVVAVAVFSHWVLDFLVHRPD